MTEMQISYRNLQETRRHNIATEGLEGSKLEETRRHNMASESEAIRTNMANEGIKHEANVINQSHYQRQDAINQAHYERQDAETARHNREAELDADYDRSVRIYQAKEEARHNLASEKETARHNITTESEANRHNITTESYSFLESASGANQKQSQATLNTAAVPEQKAKSKYAETQQKVQVINGVTRSVKDIVDSGVNIAKTVLAPLLKGAMNNSVIRSSISDVFTK